MYESFFGLSQAPFSLTPNTQFFLKTESHTDGLETLLVALQSREGFIKITGEVGTGKTLLCRKLLNALGDDYVSAYVPNPLCSSESLYELVADELAIEPDSTQDYVDSLLKPGRRASDFRVSMVSRINDTLLRYAELGQRVVLIVDEAQSMPPETVEALRLLTNLETESEKLLQVVLFGQPELNDLLDRPELRQLKQRITFSHHIEPLSFEGVAHYVSHRLMMAGYSGERMFDVVAMDYLYQASKGIPRLVNVLCHKALMLAYGEGTKHVTKQHLILAARDTEAADEPRSGLRKLWNSFATA